MADEAFVRGEPSMKVTWKCACCGRSSAWFPKGAGVFQAKDAVYDRGPWRPEIDGKTYDACSQACARDIYLTKTLGAIVCRLPKHTHTWGPWQRIGEAPVAFRECLTCEPPASERERVDELRKKGVLFP